MPCFHPLQGWYSRAVNPVSGKRKIVFDRSKFPMFFKPDSVEVPCGRCRGCRLERSRQWAIRCVHEASLHDFNCFITLTFSPEHLNKSGSLVKRDFVLFMKRLRKRFGSGIRFFHCGEYGEKFSRPHHHACLFNFDFPDKVFLRKSAAGADCYTSEILFELWPFGLHEIGDVTFESAAYVARYCMKKINGDMAPDHYLGREPEYVTMSRRPGIAAGWIYKFKSDVFPDDFVVIRGGIKCKPPKYYFRSFELTDPVSHGLLHSKRIERAKASVDNTPERLAVREVIQQERCKQLKRSFEHG